MRYLIDFSYDGTNFSGYQNQPKLRTVQNELEKAISHINKKNNTIVYASGRTDAGVHALHQMAHFDIDTKITIDKLKRGLNSNLPEDIHINSVKRVEDEFNARFHATKKRYVYKINIGEYNPIMRKYIYQYNKPLDIKSMKKAIKLFKGTHDFTSFVSSEDKREDKVRTIYKVSIKEKDSVISISFIANGFMKYQVRNMVGLLIEIGNGKKDIKSVPKIISSKNRQSSGKTASSVGLYLDKVWY